MRKNDIEKNDVEKNDVGIIISPGGEMQYCQSTVVKDKYNPYFTTISLDDTTEDHTNISINGEMLTIQNSILEQALQLQCDAYLIRILCVFDFFINISHILVTNNYQYYSLLVSIVAFWAYYSTYTYNKCGIFTYLIYQYMLSILKIIVTYLYIITSINNTPIYVAKNYFVTINYNTFHFILILLTTIAQIYITYFVQRFYRKLPSIPS